MSDLSHIEEPLAVRLAVALKRLRARLREAVLADSTDMSISLLAILRRLRTEGPTTASALAVVEHVSQQAIAQNVATLKRAGLVETTPDPNDRRKSMINMTEAGQHLFKKITASRNAWLVQAIDSSITADELPALTKAVEILERLADAEVPAKHREI